MYIVGFHVIETYSGQPYTSFVEERIFVPLGMTSTTFSPAKAEASGKFTQGWTKQGRRLPEPFDEETAILMAGPGGVISNAVDMVSLHTLCRKLSITQMRVQAKWILAWINEGVHDDQTVFPASVYRNVSYSYSIADDHLNTLGHSVGGYGMGWLRSSYRGHDVRDGYDGFLSLMAYDILGGSSLRRASRAFYTHRFLAE